jgi:hypothetical protein
MWLKTFLTKSRRPKTTTISQRILSSRPQKRRKQRSRIHNFRYIKPTSTAIVYHCLGLIFV